MKIVHFNRPVLLINNCFCNYRKHKLHPRVRAFAFRSLWKPQRSLAVLLWTKRHFSQRHLKNVGHQFKGVAWVKWHSAQRPSKRSCSTGIKNIEKPGITRCQQWCNRESTKKVAGDLSTFLRDSTAKTFLLSTTFVNESVWSDRDPARKLLVSRRSSIRFP